MFTFTGVDPFVGCQKCHLFGDHAASPQEKAVPVKVDLKKDPSFSHETQEKAFYTQLLRERRETIKPRHAKIIR